MSSFLSTGHLAEDTLVVPTSGTTYILKPASPSILVFTGSEAQTVQLPDSTALVVGVRYLVINQSTESITIKDPDDNTVATVAAGSKQELRVLDNSMPAGSWDSTTSGGGASSLAQLSDVLIPTTTSGDLLRYDGGTWVNNAPVAQPTETINTIQSEMSSPSGIWDFNDRVNRLAKKLTFASDTRVAGFGINVTSTQMRSFTFALYTGHDPLTGSLVASVMRPSHGAGLNTFFLVAPQLVTAGDYVLVIYGTGLATYSASYGQTLYSLNSGVSWEETSWGVNYELYESVISGNEVIKTNDLGQLDSSLLQYNINFGSNILSGVATPVGDTDAANKQYVDSAVSGGSLSGLSDVALSTLGSGDVLSYDGTQWTNSSGGGGGGSPSEAYSDVTLSATVPSAIVLAAPASGQYYHITQVDALATTGAAPLTDGKLTVANLVLPSTFTETSTSVPSGTQFGEQTTNYTTSVTATLQKRISTSLGTAGSGKAYNPAIAVDDVDGSVYIAFKDVNAGYTTTVSKYMGGTTWAPVGGEGALPILGSNIGIVARNGVIFVALYDNIGASLSAFKYESGSWSTIGTGLSSGASYDLDMALDSVGALYVAYTDSSSGYKISVKRYYNSTWSLVGAGNFSDGQAAFPRIAIDSNDVVYVLYRDDANSQKLTVMRYSGGATWSVVGAKAFTDGQSNYPSLLIDKSTNIPYVAYQDIVNGAKATVMKYVNGWVLVGGKGFSNTMGRCTLLMDTTDNNTLYLSIEDTANSGGSTMMKYSGGVWKLVGTRAFNGFFVNSSAGVISSGGVIYLTFIDVNWYYSPAFCYSFSLRSATSGDTDSSYKLRVYYKLRSLLS